MTYRSGISALLLTAAACGDQPIKPRLEELQEEIFTPSCSFSSCHGGSNPEREMSLEKGKSYASLVNVRSPVLDGVRVMPSDTANSLIMVILREGIPNPDRDVDTEQMPPGQPLGEREITAIKRWIERGAQDN